ncbi:MAG: thioredoxin family protein [Beijerinckiaceae bacterium]|nr:thioredoxin family protein [Beijerinckiaceae bacterium]
MANRGVGFAAIQTVFEGEHENTFDKLRKNQLAYSLPIAFGHDVVGAGSRSPSFMEDYRTRGTPWFAVIDGDGRLLFSDFHLDADSLAAEVVRIDGERAVASE